MKSKTKISKQIEKKTNSELVETIKLAKKNKAWLEVASVLSGPRRNWSNLNLDELKEVKGDVVVAGKVLSQGDVSKKKIVALKFSERAKEKLKKDGCDFKTMLEEIKSNPEMKGLKFVR